MEYRESNYLNVERNSSKYYANPGNYEDQIINNNDFIDKVAIPSKVIKENFLKVFVVFNDNIEDRLTNFNVSLKPLEDQRGLKSNIQFTGGNITRKEIKKRDSLRKVFYKTFNEVHKVYIDDKLYESSFIVSTDKYKNLGFESYLDIENLPTGKHILELTRKRINKKKKDILKIIWVQIPFWKFNK